MGWVGTVSGIDGGYMRYGVVGFGMGFGMRDGVVGSGWRIGVIWDGVG